MTFPRYLLLLFVALACLGAVGTRTALGGSNYDKKFDKDVG